MIKWKICINRMEREIVNLRKMNASLITSLIEAQSLFEECKEKDIEECYKMEEIVSIFDPQNIPLWPDDEEIYGREPFEEDESSEESNINGSDDDIPSDNELFDGTDDGEHDEDSDESIQISKRWKNRKRIKREILSSDDENLIEEEKESRNPRHAFGLFVNMDKQKVC